MYLFDFLIPLLIIFISLIILFFICNKKKKSNNYDDINNNNNIELDNKVKSMSVEEYNRYLEQQDCINFLKARSKLEKIIDVAYQDYINKCKIKRKYIDNYFFINKDTYGITKEDINSFPLTRKVEIKNYIISREWQHISYLVPDYLEVEIKR